MAYTKVTGALVGSLSDLDLTNVGDIQLDSISGDSDTNTSITFPGSDVMVFDTGGTERLRINSSGSVILNHANPEASSLLILDKGGNGSAALRFYNAASNTAALTLNSDENLVLEATNDIIIDSGGQNVYFEDDGTRFMSISQVSSDVYFGAEVSDKDMIFRVNDNGTTVTALTLDGSDAGRAIFTGSVALDSDSGQLQLGDDNDMQVYHNGSHGTINVGTGNLGLDIAGDLSIDADGGDIVFNDGGSEVGRFTNSSSDFVIKTATTDKDQIFQGNDGGSIIEAMRIDYSAGGRVGIGTTSPDASLHNAASDVTNVHYDTAASTILEATENVVQITAADSGSNATALLLSNAGSSGDNKHWIFHHGGTSKSNRLDIGYGTSSGTGFDGRGDIASDLTILTDGSVGIGTTSPSDELHVKGGSTSAFIRVDNSADGHDTGFNIYQNGSRKWEIHSDDSNTDALELRPDGASGKFLFAQNGTFILNGTSAEANGSCTWSIGARNPVQCFNASAYVQNSEFMTFRNQGTQIGSIIMSNTNATTYGTSSDYRLKENVSDMTGATAKLKQLKPKRFNWIADTTNTLQDGFLAHEVSPVVPEAIIGDKDAKDSDDNPIYQQIDNSKLVPLLVKAIQEQQTIIEDLKSRIETLEG